MRATVVALAAAAAVVPAARGYAFQERAETRRVDLGGFWLGITCMGAGTPVVVLDGGAGTWSVHYRHIQDEVARTTRVCAYDRAGLGSSDPSPSPRTSLHMAGELNDLLHSAGEDAPFVLVGHSLGGYNVRVFADRFPDRVAGMVLMESGHEDQFERLPPEVAAVIGEAGPRFRAMAEMARRGELPAEPLPDLPAFETHPELIRGYEESVARPTHYLAIASEMEDALASADQAGESGSLGDLPLVVVTAGNSYAPYAGLGIPVAAANETWLELQGELVGLSTNATQLIAPDATHGIDTDAPELVVEAIRRVVEEARQVRARALPPEAWGNEPFPHEPPGPRAAVNLETGAVGATSRRPMRTSWRR